MERCIFCKSIKVMPFHIVAFNKRITEKIIRDPFVVV